jgi:hypothetical protein
MNTVVVHAALLLAISCTPDKIERATPQKEIDCYILIGDSNQNGAVYEADAIDSTLISNEKTLVYFKPDRSPVDNGEWQHYSIRKTSASEINRVPGHLPNPQGPYNYGTDQSFIRTITAERQEKIAIIKMARGGSSLIERSGEENDWSIDDLYPIFKDDFYSIAQEKIHHMGYSLNVRGVIVRLGTNDCTKTVWNKEEFESNVHVFLNRLSDDLGPTVPIFWVQVRQDLYKEPAKNHPFAAVTEAREVLSSIKHPNFHLVNYDTCRVQSDGVHFTADAYKWQGIYEASLF